MSDDYHGNKAAQLSSMTLSDKIFASVWFLLVVPALFLLSPTFVTFIVVLSVSLVFLTQAVLKLSWRCNSCGHFTKLAQMPNKARFLRGEMTCSHCGKTQTRSKSYVRSTV
ncbi:hypothetical protein [Kordiimonas marina]|uniref:hypothetical protein n=1 Tax=Kordiimonas marina TaxID=2872312 RepID=UPI001FF219BC|nr:hypothetical protein [Kordiimonas marina]MCJ9428861.1 hypothetical protein [Kordiimonas marina]